VFCDPLNPKGVLLWAALIFSILVSAFWWRRSELRYLSQSPGYISCTQDLNGREFLFSLPLNVNRVTLEQLDQLPGVGLIEAQKIIKFVGQMGFLLDVSELEFPEGPLSPREYQRLKIYLSVR